MKFPKFSHSGGSNAVWISGAAIAGIIVIAVSGVPTLTDEEIVDKAGVQCNSRVMEQLSETAVLGNFQRGERDGAYVIAGQYTTVPSDGEGTSGKYECVWTFDTTDDGVLEVFVNANNESS